MTQLRLLVIGHARHGKDTVCEMLRDRWDMAFASSSLVCAEKIVFPALAPIYGYVTVEECFADRANHRVEWFDLIRQFNRDDLTRLGRAVFANYDIYAGLRNHKELHAMHNAGVYDVALWIDASERRPPEPRTSCTVEPWMADYVIDNNGSVEDLKRNVDQLMHHLRRNDVLITKTASRVRKAWYG